MQEIYLGHWPNTIHAHMPREILTFLLTRNFSVYLSFASLVFESSVRFVSLLSVSYNDDSRRGQRIRCHSCRRYFFLGFLFHPCYLPKLTFTGGTAACIIAGRLAQADPSMSILIIEGGKNNLNDLSVTNSAIYLAIWLQTPRPQSSTSRKQASILLAVRPSFQWAGYWEAVVLSTS